MPQNLFGSTRNFEIHMGPWAAPRAREAQPQKDIVGHWKIIHNARNIQLIFIVQQALFLSELDHFRSNGSFSRNITQLWHGTAADLHEQSIGLRTGSWFPGASAGCQSLRPWRSSCCLIWTGWLPLVATCDMRAKANRHFSALVKGFVKCRLPAFSMDHKSNRTIPSCTVQTPHDKLIRWVLSVWRKVGDFPFSKILMVAWLSSAKIHGCSGEEKVTPYNRPFSLALQIRNLWVLLELLTLQLHNQCHMDQKLERRSYQSIACPLVGLPLFFQLSWMKSMTQEET